MTTITVVPIIDFEARPKAPLTRMMNERLEGFAADLQAYLDKQLLESPDGDDLVIYMSYNSNYAIRWTIVSDVPAYIAEVVADKCAKLGYIAWKGIDLYKFK
ncbi:hypothetical protein [Pedobacter heparinus]|uniref:Uncharacterized protein n=1 Tax=Pedobacter heparinus (strain ATCC 13125 / DSM 2366 / CIP 104194 / JCM 7457 / NBRC 12017 / NCIMB 9290 / NRRL B-14731 / HIM 762-3) TaxID=485917 RepID=C6XSA7_PEDHD|nr:hypothetical protein [Pedobacter heparinus]ACU03452.1 hypothetical protein Phep_1236 [Pedobacter heparinus DSM 2366]